MDAQLAAAAPTGSARHAATASRATAESVQAEEWNRPGAAGCRAPSGSGVSPGQSSALTGTDGLSQSVVLAWSPCCDCRCLLSLLPVDSRPGCFVRSERNGNAAQPSQHSSRAQQPSTHPLRSRTARCDTESLCLSSQPAPLLELAESQLRRARGCAATCILSVRLLLSNMIG